VCRETGKHGFGDQSRGVTLRLSSTVKRTGGSSGRLPWHCRKCATGWAYSCWRSTARLALTTSVAKCTVN